MNSNFEFRKGYVELVLSHWGVSSTYYYQQVFSYPLIHQSSCLFPGESNSSIPQVHSQPYSLHSCQYILTRFQNCFGDFFFYESMDGTSLIGSWWLLILTIGLEAMRKDEVIYLKGKQHIARHWPQVRLLHVSK